MPAINATAAQPFNDAVRWWSSLAPSVQHAIESGGIVISSFVLAKMVGTVVRYELTHKGFDSHSVIPFPPPPPAPRASPVEPAKRPFTVCDATGWLASAFCVFAGCWLAARHARSPELAVDLFNLGKIVLTVGACAIVGTLIAGKLSDHAVEAYTKSNADAAIERLFGDSSSASATAGPAAPLKVALAPVVGAAIYWLTLAVVALVLADLFGLKEVSRLINEFVIIVPRFLVACCTFALCWFALRAGPSVIAGADRPTSDGTINTAFRAPAQVIYVFAVVAAVFALLGIHSVTPGLGSIIFVAMLLAAYAYRRSLREALYGLYLAMQEPKGKKIKLGAEEFSIVGVKLLSTSVENASGQQQRPNSEVAAALH